VARTLDQLLSNTVLGLTLSNFIRFDPFLRHPFGILLASEQLLFRQLVEVQSLVSGMKLPAVVTLAGNQKGL